jgi:Arc/MetJ-type ribon-helix-helix transcriptional regulator
MLDWRMAVTVTLDQHGEKIIEAHLRTGRYHSPEEVVARALETLSHSEPPEVQPRKTPSEAVAHIRQSRKGITLGGLKIRELIHEGRKY